MQTAQTHDNVITFPNSLQSLREQIQRGGEHLGDVVWWLLSEVSVSHATLEAEWLGHGLSPKLLPEPQTPQKALRQAVRTVQIGKRNVDIINSVDTNDHLVFTVSRAQPVDNEGNVTYAQEARMTLDKRTGILGSDHNTELTERIRTEYDVLLSSHTARDIMMMITKALQQWSAVTLRDTGGIYYVPRTQSENLRRLRDVVKQFGKSQMFLLPVHSTDEAKQSLGTAAAGSIEAELTALQEEIHGFMQEPEGVRPSTLARRLEAFGDLRSRADLYRTILNVTVSDLGGQIQKLEQQVETMLAQKRNS